MTVPINWDPDRTEKFHWEQFKPEKFDEERGVPIGY
jgi:hypothetical protein